MKNKLLATALFVLALFATSSLIAAPKSEKKTIVFSVLMDCQGCADKIEKNIAFEKGVKDMKIDLKGGKITIVYLSPKTSPELLIAAFKKIGYEAVEIKTDQKP